MTAGLLHALDRSAIFSALAIRGAMECRSKS